LENKGKEGSTWKHIDKEGITNKNEENYGKRLGKTGKEVAQGNDGRRRKRGNYTDR